MKGKNGTDSSVTCLHKAACLSPVSKEHIKGLLRCSLFGFVLMAGLTSVCDIKIPRLHSGDTSVQISTCPDEVKHLKSRCHVCHVRRSSKPMRDVDGYVNVVIHVPVLRHVPDPTKGGESVDVGKT